MKKDRSKCGKGHGKSFIILVAMGLFIFGYGKGWGADWKRYMADDLGSWFYDAETISHPSKDTVRVWNKTDYTDKGVIRRAKEIGIIYNKYNKLATKYKDSKVQALASEYKDLESKYKDLSYEQNLVEVNCVNIKTRTLKGTAYSRNGLLLYTYTPKAPDWNEVVTGSVAEVLYKKACKQPRK